MGKIAFLFTVLVTALVCLLPAAPAQAQASRTFVSAAGSDSNNCINVATPCRHLAAAYAATAPNGEIYVLDPANYGSLAITGPVSIEGHGWASIAPSAVSAAIAVVANPGDKINIIGVVLDGVGVPNSQGIGFFSGGILEIRDSVIRNFPGNGITFNPTSSTPSQLFVSNTLVSDNGNAGIQILPDGLGTVNVVLDHVAMENNIVGLDARSYTHINNQTTNVTVSDSVSVNNAFHGISADTGNGIGTVNVMVRSSTIANNGFFGLSADDPGTTIRVTRSTITGNATAWTGTNSAVVLSYGDNNIDGNTNANTAPPNPLTYK